MMKVFYMLVLLAVHLSTAYSQAPVATLRTTFIQRTEAQLGKELTMEQKQEIAKLSKESKPALLAVQEKFIKSVSQLVQLTDNDIKEMLPRIGQENKDFEKDIISKIELKLGRKITDEERAQIAEFEKVKKADLEPIQKNFARKVSKIIGLPEEEILKMLP